MKLSNSPIIHWTCTHELLYSDDFWLNLLLLWWSSDVFLIPSTFISWYFKKELSFLPVDLLICLFTSVWIQRILFYSRDFNPSYSLFILIFKLAFTWLVGIIVLWALPWFLTQQCHLGSSCIFPAPALE